MVRTMKLFEADGRSISRGLGLLDVLISQESDVDYTPELIFGC